MTDPRWRDVDSEPRTPPPYPMAVPAARPGRAATAAAIALVAGAFAVVLAAVPSRVFDLERYLAPKELALAATALLLLAVLLPGWRKVEAGAADTLLVAYVAWSALSAALASNRALAFDALGVSFGGLVVFLAARLAERRGAGRTVLVGLALASTLAAGLGIAQAYGVDLRVMADSRPPGGTFGNRNFLAHVTAIAAPILLLLTLRSRRSATVAAGLVALAAAVAIIVLTRSRAAWLALGVSIAVMSIATLVGRNRPLAGIRHARAVVIGLVLIAAAAVAIALPNALRWRSDSPYAETLTGLANYQEGSGHGRLVQYGNSLRMLRFRPVLGVGPGNWFVHYPRVTTPGDPSFAGYDPIPTNPWPSSDWVAILAERGVIGLLLLSLAALAAAISAVRRLRGDPTEASRAVAVLGTLTAAFVAGSFNAVTLLAAPTLFVAAIVGVLLPVEARRPFPSLEGGPRRALGWVALVLGLAFTIGATGRVAALVIARQGQRSSLVTAARLAPGSHRLQLLLSRSGSCRQRLPHARAARRLMPYHSAPRRAVRACGG